MGLECIGHLQYIVVLVIRSFLGFPYYCEQYYLRASCSVVNACYLAPGEVLFSPGLSVCVCLCICVSGQYFDILFLGY